MTLKLEQLLEMNLGYGDRIWAKVDPEANAFTFDSEADYSNSETHEDDDFIFFCDGGYLKEHIEMGGTIESLLDEINETVFG